MVVQYNYLSWPLVVTTVLAVSLLILQTVVCTQ